MKGVVVMSSYREMSHEVLVRGLVDLVAKQVPDERMLEKVSGEVGTLSAELLRRLNVGHRPPFSHQGALDLFLQARDEERVQLGYVQTREEIRMEAAADLREALAERARVLAQTASDVSLAKDDAGKARYSNEALRKAEVESRMSDHEVEQQISDLRLKVERQGMLAGEARALAAQERLYQKFVVALVQHPEGAVLSGSDDPEIRTPDPK